MVVAANNVCFFCARRFVSPLVRAAHVIDDHADEARDAIADRLEDELEKFYEPRVVDVRDEPEGD